MKIETFIVPGQFLFSTKAVLSVMKKLHNRYHQRRFCLKNYNDANNSGTFAQICF